MLFPFNNQINCDTVGFRAWVREKGELSIQSRNKARGHSWLAPPTGEMSLVNESTHQSTFGWNAGCHLSALLLLAVAGVSKTNCHHGFLDLHAAHYDIMLGEGAEIAEDNLFHAAVMGKVSRTKMKLTFFPLIVLN